LQGAGSAAPSNIHEDPRSTKYRRGEAQLMPCQAKKWYRDGILEVGMLQKAHGHGYGRHGMEGMPCHGGEYGR